MVHWLKYFRAAEANHGCELLECASCESKLSWENALKCTIDTRERSKRPQEWRKPAGGRCSSQIYPSVFFHSDAAQNIVLAPLPVSRSLARLLFSLFTQCRRHLLSLDSLWLMKLSYAPIAAENDAWKNEVLRWIRFKMCYVHRQRVSQVWLSAECRFCARRGTRIRSPLELSYFVRNRKPKIDSRRRYKLYEIYWVARDRSRRDNRHERRWKAIALIGSFLHFQKRICRG